jgi:hypothetical protein
MEGGENIPTVRKLPLVDEAVAAHVFVDDLEPHNF